MDFILEHNDDPIPDPASVTTSTSSAPPSNEPINVDDEDEDEAAALRAAYGPQSGDASQAAGSGADVEARVSRPYLMEARNFIILDVPEHQMFTVR
jgi:UBX domain-containing protein 1/4